MNYETQRKLHVDLIDELFGGATGLHHKFLCSAGCRLKTKCTFKHDWLSDDGLAFCQTTGIWWVIYKEGEGMFCLLCKKHDCKNIRNKTTVFNKAPSTRLRSTTLKEHVKTGENPNLQHENAIAQEMLQRSSFFQKALDQKKIHGDEAIYKAFKTFYFVAKEELPNIKALKLISFLENLGLSDLKYFDHRSQRSSQEIFNTIGDTLLSNIVTEINSSQCMGLLCDDVSDVSTIEQMVTFVQYVHNGEVKVKFLSVDNLLEHSTSPNAITMHQTLKSRFDKFELKMTNICALASDGAAVMTGKTGGLGARLKEDSPQCINIHCICHRLALACVQTVKDTKQITQVELNLTQLWKYFEGSPKRMAMYTKSQIDKYQRQTVPGNATHKKISRRLKKACRTRWLSFDKSVDAAVKDLDSILLCLSSLAEECPTADGFLKKMKKAQWVASLYILEDILPVLSILSKTFQGSQINFSEIGPNISITITTLRAKLELKQAQKKLKEDFATEGRFALLEIKITDATLTFCDNLQSRYIDKLIENIQARFDATLPVLSAFNVFNPDCLPDQNSELWTSYGTDEIKVLADHFGLSAESLMDEFKLLKYHLIGIGVINTVNCLKYIVNTQPFLKLMPKISKIATIILSIPVSNAWPERGASCLKRIKTRLRSSIGQGMLNALMHITINGPPVQSGDAHQLIVKAVENWTKAKTRKKVKPALSSNVSHVGCQAGEDENPLEISINQDMDESTEADEECEIQVVEESEDLEILANLGLLDSESEGGSEVDSDEFDFSDGYVV